MAQSVLRIEKLLAVAHQAVYASMREASNFSDLGLHDDLQLYLIELERLQENLLRARGRRPTAFSHPAYLSSSPRDDSRSTS